MTPKTPATRVRDDFARQSPFPTGDPRSAASPRSLHVAIIMDGNGRWARRRSLPRHAGHPEGAKSVRTVIEAAADPVRRIRELTLYAFSSDNWNRPREEVAGILRLLARHLRRETPRLVANDVRLLVVGRRDRLPPRLVAEIEAAEAATKGSGGLTVRLAIDYSARDALVRAVCLAALRAARGDGPEALGRDDVQALLAEAGGQPGPVPDVDLLIRSGGERRLSDFLLWECAYAELHFTPTLWPDFGAAELDEALAEFARRDRRFGSADREPKDGVRDEQQDGRERAIS